MQLLKYKSTYLLFILLLIIILLIFKNNIIEARIEKKLEKYFNARVELDSLSLPLLKEHTLLIKKSHITWKEHTKPYTISTGSISVSFDRSAFFRGRGIFIHDIKINGIKIILSSTLPDSDPSTEIALSTLLPQLHSQNILENYLEQKDIQINLISTLQTLNTETNTFLSDNLPELETRSKKISQIKKKYNKLYQNIKLASNTSDLQNYTRDIIPLISSANTQKNFMNDLDDTSLQYIHYTKEELAQLKQYINQNLTHIITEISNPELLAPEIISQTVHIIISKTIFKYLEPLLQSLKHTNSNYQKPINIEHLLLSFGVGPTPLFVIESKNIRKKNNNNNAQNSLPITLSIFSTHDSFKLQGKTKIQYKQGISFLQVDISYSDIPLYIRTQEINALELKEISGTLDGTFHLSKESPFSYNIQNQNILHISSVVPIPKLENGTKISKELMDKKDFSFDTHILIENNTTTLSQTENSISKNSTIVDATTQILTHNIALIFQNLKDPVSILVENYAHTILTDTSEKLSSMQKKLNIQKPKANKLYDDLVTLMEYSNKKTSSIIKDNINAHTKNIGNQIRQKIRNAIATP